MPMTPEDRRTLSEAVDGFWLGKRDKKDELEAIAEVKYAELLRACARQTAKTYAECAREAQKTVDLRTKYKEFWGKK